MKTFFLLLAVLLFAIVSPAQTAAPSVPAVSTFSVTTSVASLPIVGQTVAANVTGAGLQVTQNPNNNISVNSVNVLSGSVQVYMGGLSQSFLLDKVTPKNWLAANWHFKASTDEAFGVSESTQTVSTSLPDQMPGIATSSNQHIAVMFGGRFAALIPGASKFSLVGGLHYINAAGVSGHVMVTLGPSIAW